MTTPLEQWDAHLQSSIDVPTNTLRRARAQVMSLDQGKAHRMIFRTGFVAMSAFGVLVLILVSQLRPAPSSPKTSLSFLQTAEAAYADMQAKGVEMGDSLRHIIQTVEHTGTMNPGSERYEIWENADGTRVLTETQSYLAGSPTQLFADGVRYLPPAYIYPVVDALEPGETNYHLTPGLAITSAYGHHTVSMPINLNADAITQDPSDPAITCYQFEWKPQGQIDLETYSQELKAAAGFDGGTPGSTDQTIKRLIEGQEKGYVEDLGIQLVDGKSEHVFEIVETIVGGTAFSDQVNTTQFGFDSEAYLLTSIDFASRFDNIDTSDHYQIIVDELVDPSTAPLAYRDPTAAGLVIQPEEDFSHGETIYPISEAGCYRDTAEGVERLSLEEEAEVKQRIEMPF